MVRDLVRMVGEAVGERVEVNNGPPVPGDVRSTWADLHRADARRLSGAYQGMKMLV
jgi:hypothetical protein